MRIERSAKRASRGAVMLAVVAALLAAGSVPAQEAPPAKRGAGWVDPRPFLELAGTEHLVLEVNIEGALLKLLTSAMAGEEPDLSETVAGLDGIHAVIVDIADPARRERAERLARSVETRLSGRSWQRVAVVRQEDSDITVLTRSAGDRIDGLVVLVESKTDRQLVFVNISGTIDLARLNRLGRELDIPGLDRVPPPAPKGDGGR